MKYSYLALGDSYTIGEQVLLAQSFPYQTIQILRQKNISIFAPEIVAKTGWTTEELNFAIDETLMLPHYDFVSLLIGVNNQYREGSMEEYTLQFEKLLVKAINFAGKVSSKVFVLSIPDWGTMPFAKEKNTDKIAIEIDAYNETCKYITQKHQAVFIDITQSQRADSTQENMIASDGLHPSAIEYSKWANKLADAIAAVCSV